MNVLTDYINKEYVRNRHNNAGAIHPSSLGDCDRLAIYSYKGLEPDVAHDEITKKRFFHGRRIEEWMNDALHEKGILIANGVPVKAEVEGIPVEGTIDHNIRWNDGWCIADTKSVSDFALKRYGRGLPYPHHVLQVGAYEWALDGSRYLHHGPRYPPVLFYIGRGNLVEQPVCVGSQAQEWAYEKLQILAHYAKQDIVPDRPFHTPNEHPYLCKNTIYKGGYQRKDGTYAEGKEPKFTASCSWFYRCWKVSKELTEWSFWSQVKDEYAI